MPSVKVHYCLIDRRGHVITWSDEKHYLVDALREQPGLLDKGVDLCTAVSLSNGHIIPKGVTSFTFSPNPGTAEYDRVVRQYGEPHVFGAVARRRRLARTEGPDYVPMLARGRRGT